MGSSGLGQRELAGESEEEHRVVLPNPETQRSWEERGESPKAATGDRKEEVSQIGVQGERSKGEHGEAMYKYRWSTRWSFCLLGPAWKLEPWLSVLVNSLS